MAKRRLIVIGGGEHARVVADAARSRSREFELLGFVGPSGQKEPRPPPGLQYLGRDEVLADYPDAVLILGIGGVAPNHLRREVAERTGRSGSSWVTVVHAQAIVSRDAVLSAGTVVMAGAIVQPGVRVGRHCIINTGAVIDHDVEVGDFSQIASGAVIGGGAVVEADALVGLGAVVRDHCRIGAGAFIAMGAVVVEDVPAGETVSGVPARRHGSGRGKSRSQRR